MKIKRYVGIDNRGLENDDNVIKVASQIEEERNLFQGKTRIYPLTYFNTNTGMAKEDWFKGKYVLEFRVAKKQEQLSKFCEHHIIKNMGVVYVPIQFDGLKKGDCIGVVFDGNNLNFLKKLIKETEQKGSVVMGISQKELKEFSKKTKFRNKQKAEIIKLLLEEDIRYFSALEI